MKEGKRKKASDQQEDEMTLSQHSFVEEKNL